MDAIVADKIRGVIFGQAIGDALGFATEFLPKSEVNLIYPDGLTDYSQIRFFSKITNQFEDLDDWRWQPGDWTDDTDQMVCILDSLLACGQVNLKDIATRFQDWAVRDAFGIGGTVSRVVNDPFFLENPHRVAQEVWETKGRQSAANGGVMRTSVLGVWQYQDLDKVRWNAEQVCKMTHADPRCIASCIAVCFAISRLIQGESNIEALVETIASEVQIFHPEIKDCFREAKESSLEMLRLDEGLNPRESFRISYTLKTLAAGFWALLKASTFREGILQIIHEGGDADTNGAVAGALLGAKFGYSRIEDTWIDGLIHKETLENKVNQLLQLCQG
jgi:ADP-ribosylglycohydrolase